MEAMAQYYGYLDPPEKKRSAQLTDFVDFAKSSYPYVKDIKGGTAALSEFYTVGLPRVANKFGQRLEGLEDAEDPGLISTLSNIGRSLGYDCLPADFSHYSRDQNFYNLAVGLAARNGLGRLLQCLLSQDRKNLSTKEIARRLLPTVLDQPQITEMLMETVGPQNVGDTKSLVRKLSRNPKLSLSTVGTVVDIAGRLGTDGETVYGAGKLKPGGPVIWESAEITRANPKAVKALTGKDLGRTLGGTKLPVTPSGVVWYDRPAQPAPKLRRSARG
jgi:hypothetical protein